ncbi:MAG: PAS domain-containing protein [Bacteroidia bacterium]|nr:PAS domain-containing protein [Bacteroidia bacterium]
MKKRVSELLELLTGHTGVDFFQYKPATLLRRLRRRMELAGFHDEAAYVAHVRTHPEELERLFASMLIGVTEFLRDPEVFEAIRRQLPALLSSKQGQEPLRCWSAGTATGEEAYTLAMLVQEGLEAAGWQPGARIFATDLVEASIRTGRAGIYTHEAVQALPAAWRERFLQPEGPGTWRIADPVRRLVLFSAQNLISDPPFVNLDLIVCRNVLIYLKERALEQLLQVFHYSLADHGLLVLGKSEGLHGLGGWFEPADERLRIYRKVKRLQSYRIQPWLPAAAGGTAFSPAGSTLSQPVRGLRELAREALSQAFDYPFVVISQHAEILESAGSLRLYLEPQPGQTAPGLFRLLNPDLRIPVQSALHRVQQGAAVSRTPWLVFELLGARRYTRITVRPLDTEAGVQPAYVVAFESPDPDLPAEAEAALPAAPPSDDQELNLLREQLDAYRTELERSRAEIQAMRAEAQAMNEELRSANEELEATNEELRTLNEQLILSNEHFQQANDALRRKEQDLRAEVERAEYQAFHLKLAQEVASFGSWELRFDTGSTLNSDYVFRLFGLEPGAITPGIDTLARHIHPDDAPRVIPVISQALQQRKPYDLEYRTLHPDGRTVWIRDVALVFHNAQGEPVRMVGVNQDIQAYKEIQHALLESEARYRMIVEGAPIPIVVHQQLRISYVNDAAVRMLMADGPESLMGREVLGFVHPEDMVPVSRRILQLYQSDQQMGMNEFRVRREDGRYIVVRGGGRHIMYDGQAAVQLMFYDVTAEKEALSRLMESEARLRRAQEIGKIGMWEFDLQTESEWWSDRMYRILGYEPGEVTPERELARNTIPPEDLEMIIQKVARAVEFQEPYSFEHRVYDRNGELKYLYANAELVLDAQQRPIKLVGTSVDVTELKRQERHLREHEYRLRQAQEIGKIGIWEHDVQTGRGWWSDSLYRMLGLDPAIPVEEAIRSLLTPEEVQRLSAMTFGALGQGPYQFDYKVTLPEGAVRYLFVTGDLMTDAAGKLERVLGMALDITDRKLAEEQLRNQELLLRQAQEIGRIGVWEFQFAAQTMWWSDTLYDMMGLSENRPADIAAWARAHVHPEDVALTEAAMAATMEQDQPYLFDHRMTDESGQIRYLHIQAQLFRDEQGAPHRLVGVTQDVTERKLAEKQLRDFEDRLNRAQEIGRVGAWEYDLRSGAQWWSEGFFRLIGADPADPRDKRTIIRELLTPETYAQMEYEMARFADQPLIEYHHALRRPDGQLRQMYVKAQLTRDEKGLPERIVGITQDLTELREAEARIRESERRLRHAHAIARLGSWEWDAVSGQIVWSDTLYDLCRIARGTPVTPSWLSQLVHPEDQEMTGARLAEALRTFQSYDLHFRILLADGDIRYLHATAEAMLEGGQPARMLGVIRDETDIRLAEQQILRFKQDLERQVEARTLQLRRSNLELENFAYSVSHDLRTPLRQLVSYSGLLERRAGQQLDEDNRQLLRFISWAANKMHQQVLDLLEYSRLGRQRIHPDHIDLNEILRRAAEWLGLLQPERRAVLDLHPLPPAYADGMLVEQVFLNLLSNAAKYTATRTEPRISVSAHEERGEAVICVRDNGVGFDETYKDRLFRLFQRLHPETEFEGNGIGLANVQRIVSRHHGRVWAEGKPGQGAAFYFSLPLTREHFEQAGGLELLGHDEPS